MTSHSQSSHAVAVLRTIDSIVQERVLVFGSLPPQGRDIDLLVHSTDEAAIVSKLRDEGFLEFEREWVLFSDCSVCKIDLVQTEAWNLPSGELGALFSEGRALKSVSNVVEPSAHHTLLILARKLARHRHLDPKYRRRIDAALQVEPRAWQLAHGRATLWRASTTLKHLEALYNDQKRFRPSIRMRRPRRTRIISLSGLDGAGKSSQAELLRDTLGKLGLETVVEWTPARVVSLDFLTNPARRLLRHGPRSRLPDRINPDLRPSDYSAVVTHTWVAIASVATAISLWLAVWRHLGRGRVVICDRYTLDFAVFLLYRHGANANLRFQTWLLKTMSPNVLCSYLLDVTPEVAFERKADEYSPSELRRQSELYRLESVRFNVRRVDGEQPPEAVCAEVASNAWHRLKRRSTTA